MQQFQTEFIIQTHGQNLYEFTRDVMNWVAYHPVEIGLLTLFCQHTSASLTIQENADPDVKLDLVNFYQRLVPENMNWLRHTIEGSDDMPAHIKTSLTDVHLTIPVAKGRCALGTWQGIYLFEHRKSAHRRKITAHLIAQ